MKDIPIFIISKDRLNPLKAQVEHYLKRNYTNITIVDNQSTYEPLLEWYKTCGVKVWVNNLVKPSNHVLWYLSVDMKHPDFAIPMQKNWYVFNDSDVVPNENAPDDFIEHLIEFGERYKVRKVGCALNIHDLPDHFHRKQEVISWESKFWNCDKINELNTTLYKAEIDTTFGVCRPGTGPGWSEVFETLRADGIYSAKHWPWYYDYNNLPDDENYYLSNLKTGFGPEWSMKFKGDIGK